MIDFHHVHGETNNSSSQDEECSEKYESTKTCSLDNSHTAFQSDLNDCFVNNYNDCFLSNETPLDAQNGDYDNKQSLTMSIFSNQESVTTMPHFCELCGKGCRDTTTLNRHRQTHVSILSCDECGKVYRTKKGLKNHVATHGERNFHCDVCDFKTYTLLLLRGHKKYHHEKSRYPCTQCGKGFNKKSQLVRHTVVHTNVKTHLSNTILPCDACGKVFQTKSGFNRHKVTHGERNVQCDVCNFKAYNLSQLNKHKEYHREKNRCIDHLTVVHTNAKPYGCDVCGKKFEREDLMRCHQSIEHTKDLDCYFCDYSASTTTALKKHESTHTQEKKFQCRFCDHTAKESSYIKIHERVHTNVRPYKCKDCGKGFKQQNALKDHAVVHSGEKPFKCLLCGSAFKLKIHLRRHRIMCMKKIELTEHANEYRISCTKRSGLTEIARSRQDKKLFPCYFCDFSSPNQTALATHERRHFSKHVSCQLCSRSFSTIFGLEIHMRSHQEQGSFQ